MRVSSKGKVGANPAFLSFVVQQLRAAASVKDKDFEKFSNILHMELYVWFYGDGCFIRPFFLAK